VRRYQLAAAAGAAAVLLVPAAAHAADVSGTVFRDYNSNGAIDPGSSGTAKDTGLAGITVNAYDGSGALAGSAVTSASGAYTLALPSGDYRVEVEFSSPPWFPSRNDSTAGDSGTTPVSGSTLGSDDRFVDASSARTNVDFGLQLPDEFSVNDPKLYYSISASGPPKAAPNAARAALRGIDYGQGPNGGGGTQFNAASSTGGLPLAKGGVQLATVPQIGTTYGLGIDDASGDLFAGAYYKRYAGLFDTNALPGLQHPTGAIFRITQGGAVSLFADLDAGADGHPSTSPGVESLNPGDWYSGPGAETSWVDVGKRGLGAVAVDPTNSVVWAVNLYDKTIDGFKIAAGGGVRTTPDYKAAIPSPAACTPAADWRPFSLDFDPSNGAMYLGGVCSAETTQDRGDLEGVVYRVDDPTGTPSFAQVLSFPLDYARQQTNSGSLWQPWPTTASVGAGNTGAVSPSDKRRGAASDESYPQIGKITFDPQGRMDIAMRDLMGDDSGYNVPGETTVILQAELLKACPAGGAFAIEQNGSCGGVMGVGTVPGGNPPFFFEQRPGSNLDQADPIRTIIRQVSQYQGGAAQVPGFGDVAVTALDVSGVRTGTDHDAILTNGIQWMNTSSGAFKWGHIDHTTPDYSAGGPPAAFGQSFSKANGLGDLTVFTESAPLQIGNRVWLDGNEDGVQDAGEPALGGITVQLLDAGGSVVATTTTAADGTYAFDIDAGKAYTVRIPLGQPGLAGLDATTPNVGDDRRIDSNGIVSGENDDAAVAAHGVGQNDYTFDFGFVGTPPVITPTPTPTATPPPPVETPTPTPPAATPTPTPTSGGGVLPGEAQHVAITLRKTSNVNRVRAGKRVTFKITLHNTSKTLTAHKVMTCDRLPTGLVYVSSKPKAKLKSGRRCWTEATLKPNATKVYTLVARALPSASGLKTNHATASGPDVGRRTATHRVRVLRPVRRPGGVTG